MKRIKILMVVVITMINIRLAIGQAQEIQQLVLNYTKLKQLEEILDNMYKGYKILTKGYNTIKDISEGNFNLHRTFLDGLYAVSPVVRQYKRIPLIIQYQEMIVKEYKRAYEVFRNDPNLTVREIKYLNNVYSYLFKQSLRNLDELITIVTASKIRMSDEERIKSIDRIYLEMEEKVIFLKVFNGNTKILVIERAKARHEVNTNKKLHGIAP
ncbi:TerB family tellurite resistance protein [Chryseolinea soli]|uniref:TerB family tellurite resistance protein n=1 Tax=Chryseolinea soli TaxID=2321403 RepID=A0A385SR27_9BACT|nr:TerB family tellurite resistance protein [Chryseolinea soli]AYB32000.1 TerB family tellurite resistance protein [Chryseolinea soli]